MAREIPPDVLGKIGEAADAHDAAATADADMAQKAKAVVAANLAASDAKSVSANLRTAANNAQGLAVKALTDWLANEAVISPEVLPAPGPV